MSYGGETGIRTLDTLSSIHAFQACAFSHSAISPLGKRLVEAPIGTPTRARTLRIGSARRSAVSIVAYCGMAPAGAVQALLPGSPTLLVFFQLLRQVVRDSHFANSVQLAFEPINVVLFVVENFLRQIARAVIARSHA